jgi:hypothetical protein
MLQFLFGVAFGAAGYWAWNSFGRDLLGMGGDQIDSYGGFSSPSSTSTFSSPSTTVPPTSTGTTSDTTPTSTGTTSTSS